MARLRRRSSDSFTVNDDDSDVPAHETRPSGKPLARKQSKAHVQKASSVSCQHTTSSDQIEKSRKSEEPTTRRRQIRLAPLNQLKCVAASQEIKWPAPSGCKAVRRTGASPRKAQVNAPLCIPSQEDGKAEIVEERTLDNQDGSDDSDFDLPSPNALLRSRKAPVAVAKAVLCSEIDSSDDDVIRHKRPIRARGWTGSSSDKENQGDGILRYPPPRTQVALVPRPSTPPPSSPSKGKLLSPSKRPAKIPTPPYRPSLDAFWDVKTISEWNDQYSPRKEWQSPRKALDSSEDNTSSTSPRKQAPSSPTKRSRAGIEARKVWDASKDGIARAFLTELDKTMTDSRIAKLAAETGGVQITWSKTLNSTAGRANWRRETAKTRQSDGTTIATSIKHFAAIELAEKVIDDEDRLLNVLAHEFCHLCNFMISNIRDQPHGKQFKAWGAQATKAFAHRGVKVTTKHTYVIEYKYIWSCADCAQEYKRHSKSIDVAKHSCGKCRGKLAQIKPVPRKNANSEGGYSKFVKDNFKRIKADLGPGKTQGEIMEAVARQYRQDKAEQNSSSVDDVVRKLALVTID